MGDWRVGHTAEHSHNVEHDIGWYPTYTQPIHVIDSLLDTIIENHQDDWKAIRKSALDLWREAGIILNVEHGEPIVWENGYMYYDWPSYYVADSIRFVKAVPGKEYPFTAWAPHFGNNSCIVALGLARHDEWWADYNFRHVRSTVAHEFGHALGFGHGGDGVMMGALKPNEEEISCIKDYYL